MNKNPGTNRPEIAWQPELRPDIPTVYGPTEYHIFRERIAQIDRLLLEGGIEERFIGGVLDAVEPACRQDARFMARVARNASLALRCNIARKITGLGYREFAVRLCESAVLQWFTTVAGVEAVKPPSKSTLERLDKILPPELINRFNMQLVASGCGGQTRESALGLEAPLPDKLDMYFDSSCLKANIHFPVDWVLLRDAVRTLMKASVVIRQLGMKTRMPRDPLGLLAEMNKLGMAMSATRRQPDTKRRKKKLFRQMKQLSAKVEGHARAHLEVLRNKYAQAGLSDKQAAHIAKRMEKVLEQLPRAIKQAHERIIGARPVANDDKILSLYEEGVRVIVRGKAGAEVEFGRYLWIGETQEGLIATAHLPEGKPDDRKHVMRPVQELERNGLQIASAWGDRGLYSKANKQKLEEAGIKSGLCPKAPEELAETIRQDATFAAGLKRRSATEGRIAILKNVFLGGRSHAKGSEHARQALGWAVMAHNLWVLARREIAWREECERQAA